MGTDDAVTSSGGDAGVEEEDGPLTRSEFAEAMEGLRAYLQKRSPDASEEEIEEEVEEIVEDEAPTPAALPKKAKKKVEQVKAQPKAARRRGLGWWEAAS